MTDIPQVDTIGLVLGTRYRVDALIGRGGMASVFRAHDLVLDRDVALKLFRTESTDSGEIERQRSEVAVLASLNHPGLATLFDAGVDEHDPLNPLAYVVMQLIDGSDLRARIDRGPLSRSETAQVGADLADALHHIHANGIIHRDIKPANVLMAHSDGADTRLHPKLTDFGIARLIDSTRMTATGTTIGTANYLSPEQAKGQPVGPPSDVYSLGLVLLECLTGVKAFPGPAVEAAIARVLSDPPIPENVGPEWTDLVRAMTDKDPVARPTAHDVAVELRRPGFGVRTWDDFAAGDVTVASTVASTAVLEDGPDATQTTVLAQQDTAAAATTAPTAATERLTPGIAAAPSSVTAPPFTAAVPLTPPGEEHRVEKQRRRIGPRAIVASVVILAAIIAIVAGIVFSTNSLSGDPAPAPSYPSVPGELGSKLDELQKSVEP